MVNMDLGKLWIVVASMLLLLNATPSSASRINWRSVGQVVSRDGKEYSCKCYPGDDCYPASDAWQKLNATVDGNLLVALPPAAPCYGSVDGIPTFDAAKCADVKANYNNEQWTVDQPVALLWTFWTNNTCSSTSPLPQSSCTRGFYGENVILAKTKEHIKSGVDFARENNLRLVIRNTGHDFLGRSTGYGALVINTHSFKSVAFTTKYNGPGGYEGGAVTVGAGIQLRELYRLANKQSPPVVVIGGECPTVGLAGLIQGGGHGPMATFYGLATDQALEFKVVTTSGEFVTANTVENSDLFWGLKGGGAGNLGVIVELTIKTHPEVPTAGIILNINFTHTNDKELFWKGVAAVHDLSNYWTDHGIFVNFELLPGSFHVQPIVGPNMTANQITEVAKPMFDALHSQGVPYSSVTKGFPTFFDMYIDLFEDESAGIGALAGGWIFTRQDITENPKGIVDAYRTAVDSGVFAIGHIVHPGHAVPAVENAANPVWRNSSCFTVTTVIVDGNASRRDKASAQNLITNVAGKAFREAGPHGGAYTNEGDLEEPNWQEAFWGSNYPRLYKIKQTWDPKGVLYSRTTPGTEDWEVIDDGTKLCKKL